MTTSKHLKTILKGYSPGNNPSDEIWAGQSQALPHWENLLDMVDQLGLGEIQSRQVEIQRLLEESGVTYTIYDQANKNRPFWHLDPIPFLIAPSVWDQLQTGLQQRARLLDFIFRDLYGKRELFKAGILPPELILSDRHFLRACSDIPYTNTFALRQYATDLSRSPDGQIWVIADRTQAPSGMGYAMENRITLARILPEFYGHRRVKKIAPFYQQWRSNILSSAPRPSTDPTVVLLSPGPYNATYFEHTFMASMHGFQLVQGQDLMVKDNFVWLKTLSGLEKVDVIIRHLDDNYCDPLSLRPDSQLGIAGLLEVARQGNVTVANPLGSGVLENPGLMAFMPAMCRHFLGEDLLLPNIASWWCGHTKEMNYVLEHLEQLVIKDIVSHKNQRTTFGWELDKRQKAILVQRIKQFPYRYVGQEQAIFSTAPSMGKTGLEPRYTVLRCFASAGTDNYHVMPGGLTRSAPEAGNSHVANHSGGIGKDTWVLSEQKEAPIRFNPRSTQTEFTYKSFGDLPSRMAENLFWVGRYITRVRFTARLLRIILKCQAEIENFDDSSDKKVLPILLQALTHMTMTYPGFVGEGGSKLLETPEKGLNPILRDSELVGSLAHSIKMMRGAANAVRNRWSTDTWRLIDLLDNHWEEWCTSDQTGNRACRAALDKLIDNLAAVHGLTHGSLTIEEGRPLLNLGLKIESAMLITSLFRSILNVQNDHAVEDTLLEALLTTGESLNSYRHRYRGYLRPDSVMELLLLDDSYPPSLSYAVKVIQGNLNRLPSIFIKPKLREDQKLIIRIYSRLQLADPLELAQTEEDSFTRTAFDQLMDDTYADLAQTANKLMSTFFSHTSYEPQRSFFLFEADI